MRLDRSRVFVVDPIDGTRGFIKGEDSWTVSLAVVENGVPVAGVVYAPARDEMYDAYAGGGARLNGAPLLRRVPADRHEPLIPAPGAVHQELQAAGLAYTRGPAYPSLAYRLTQVATGKLDATVVRRGCAGLGHCRVRRRFWRNAGSALSMPAPGPYVSTRQTCATAPLRRLHRVR